jgi:hypothetical protein
MLSTAQAEWLLHDLCVKYGFCLSADAHNRILTELPQDSTEFTIVVFRAEGLDPRMPSHRRLYREVEAFVAAAFERSETDDVNE